jgi:hypothetical protein
MLDEQGILGNADVMELVKNLWQETKASLPRGGVAPGTL